VSFGGVCGMFRDMLEMAAGVAVVGAGLKTFSVASNWFK